MTLFVHRVLEKALLVSGHGRMEHPVSGGRAIAWSQVSWPDAESLKAFRTWQMRDNPEPIKLTFGVPQWLHRREALATLDLGGKPRGEDGQETLL